MYSDSDGTSLGRNASNFSHLSLRKRFDDGMHIIPKDKFENTNKILRNSHIISMATMANTNDQTMARESANFGQNKEENLGNSEIAIQGPYFDHIIAKCFHLSCKSTPPNEWEKNEELVGMIIYTEMLNLKTKMFKQLLRIRPGYVYIRKSKDIKKYKQKKKNMDGIVHGALFYSLFGKYPDQMGLKDNELQHSGFSYFKRKNETEFKWLPNSITLNAASEKNSIGKVVAEHPYKDSEREMNENEFGYLMEAIESWKQGGHYNFPLTLKTSFVGKENDCQYQTLQL
eukprot:403364584